MNKNSDVKQEKLIRKGKKRKIDINVFIYWALLSSLVIAFFYGNLGVIFLQSEIFKRTEGEYLITIFQSLCGLFALYLPNMIERKWQIEFPSAFVKAYILFLYASIVLGEFRNFYYRVEHWDTMLHTFSGIMLALFGYSVITLLNNSEKILLKLSPCFIALFTFCFAVTLGAIWEIFECSADLLVGTNMQKFAKEDGTLLVGQLALLDTMKDLMVDSLGALIISLLGYIRLKSNKMINHDFLIKLKKKK